MALEMGDWGNWPLEVELYNPTEITGVWLVVSYFFIFTTIPGEMIQFD